MKAKNKTKSMEEQDAKTWKIWGKNTGVPKPWKNTGKTSKVAKTQVKHEKRRKQKPAQGWLERNQKVKGQVK